MTSPLILFGLLITMLFAPFSVGLETKYNIAERGQDFVVFRRISAAQGANGSLLNYTNQFTLLENGVSYFENGEWKESEDLITVDAEGGASALRGPNKASFSSDLNRENVFDIIAADGRRLRGGVRGIQATDLQSGNTVLIAMVRNSVSGILVGRNKIVYKDAFKGAVSADVVLVWKHNAFCQDVVLTSKPVLPEGWDPRKVRLGVITEFIPEVEPRVTTRIDSAQTGDDVIINFGSLAVIMGKAFLNGGGYTLGDIESEGTPVRKKWHKGSNGARFLIESIDWAEISDELNSLPSKPQASNYPNTAGSPGAIFQALGENRLKNWPRKKSLMAYAAHYKPQGYLIDFTIIPTQGTPTTLQSGQTYYIRSSYYSGNAVTVQAGCVVKYKNNAYMLLYGTYSFPSVGSAMPVFTSRNDDAFGEKIVGVAGETDSNGEPGLERASKAIWNYYNPNSTTIQNVKIRWAREGIRNDRNSWETSYLSIHDCIFQNITGTGSAGVTGDLSQVTTSNLSKCGVSNPGVTMSDDCSGDSDIDGLPDTWEVGYFGYIASQSGSGDPDGEGLTNQQEYSNSTNPNNSDTDNDALTDFAEIFGGHYGQPNFVDLPGMGADPRHADVFVEADYYMNYGVGSVSLVPLAQSVANVVSAFANAPTTNPDGTTGIRLHFIVDDGIDATLYTAAQLDLNPRNQEMQYFKNLYFTPGREDYFHWCLFADQNSGNGNSGGSPGVPADSFTVTLGPTYWSGSRGAGIVRNVQTESGTIMHELGHNLGLDHGGNESMNYKPNYLSLMNYNYQIIGLKVNGVSGVLDYSRVQIAAVHEDDLYEVNGFAPVIPTTEANLSTYGVFVTPKGWIDTTSGASANIDFNDNGTIQSTKLNISTDNTDLNFDGLRNSTINPSQNDWANLIFDGGQIGEGFEALSSPPSITCYNP